MAELRMLPTALYLILALMTIVPLIPLRLSVAAYLVLVHMNLTPSGFTPAVSIGAYNAVKIIALPVFLLLRLRFAGLKTLLRKPLFQFWIFFVIYVAFASFWTPFPIAALKQIGYLWAYTALFVIFVAFYDYDKNLTYRIISWSTLMAAGFTLLFNLLGLTARIDRLTSLMAPQSFGLYLALITCLLLAFSKRDVRGGVSRRILIPTLLLMLFLNGSRAGLGIVLFVLVSREFLSLLSGRLSMNRALLSVAACIALLVVVDIGLIVPQDRVRSLLEDQRPLQPVAGLVYADYSITDIGTARFRLDMYQLVLDRWQSENPFIGSGTSSAGELITGGHIYYRGYDEDTVDANRVVHNEYLRALYEWGLVGLLLLFGLLVGFVWLAVRALARSGFSREATTLAAATLALVGLVFMFENVLAAAGSPFGVAVVLLLAQLKSVVSGRKLHAT